MFPASYPRMILSLIALGCFFEVGSNNLSLAITNTLLGLMGVVMFVFIFMKGKHIVLLRVLLVSLLIVAWLVNLFAGAGFFYWFAPLFMAVFYIAIYGNTRFTPTAFSKYFPPDRDE